jgi:polysaccharide deacetylase 2 family uncharacterized protein YibQ
VSGARPRRLRRPRIAVIVDDWEVGATSSMSCARLRRPLSVALLPALPHSASMARDAARSGMEVLLDLPMEPYRYPELDPGPGSAGLDEPWLRSSRLVGTHLDTVAPCVVGVTNRMGSRLHGGHSAHMRAMLEVLAARRLFLVDAYASNLSVGLRRGAHRGVRARAPPHPDRPVRGRKPATRERWSEVGTWTERRSRGRGGRARSSD